MNSCHNGTRLPLVCAALALVCILTATSTACAAGPGSGGAAGPAGRPEWAVSSGMDASGLDLSSVPPLDGQLRHGVLPNGLAWYILPCKDADKLELSLEVNAGAFHEAEDQAGIAHFVEHMFFNGTTHFAPGSLLKLGYSEANNAWTGQESTTYEQSLQDNNEDKLRSAFLAFQDCAMGMLFDPAEVEKERGVIHEEWRRRSGSLEYHSNWLANLDPKRPLVRRLPIGTPDGILKTPVERIKAYWDTWYRPERMSFFVSGPLDADRFEALVKEYLGPITAHGPAPTSEPPLCQPGLDSNRYMTSYSDSNSDGWFKVSKPRRSTGGHTLGVLKENLVDRLTILAWKNRLNTLMAQGLISLSSAFGSVDTMWQGADYLVYGFNRKKGDVQTDFAAFVRESRRLEIHGFSQAELDVARTTLLSELERRHADKPDAEGQVQRLRDYHLNGGLVLSPDEELALSRTLLSALTREDFNAVARYWFGLEGVCVQVGTAQSDPDAPTHLFAKAVKQALGTQVEALGDMASKSAEKEFSLVPGTVVKEETPEGTGTEIWTLSNGCKVAWRKMDGNPRLVFNAIRMGGLSRLAESDLVAARLLGQLVVTAGFQDKGEAAYRDWLKQEGMTLQYWVNDSSEGYSGSTGTEGLEEFLRLVCLQGIRDGFDAPSVQKVIRGLENYAAAAERNWEVAQYLLVQKQFQACNPRFVPLNPETIKTFSADSAGRVWKTLYGNAKDYVYVICGNADGAVVKELVQKYLGALPAESSTPGPAQHYDHYWSVPAKGIKDTQFVMGTGASRVRLSISGDDLPQPEQNDFVLDGVTIILKNRLFAHIREKLGASYDPVVQSWHTGWPRSRWVLNIDFACAAGRESDLVRAVKKEIAAISADPLDAKTLESIQETCAHRENPLVLGYEGWAKKLEYFCSRGLDPSDIPYIPSRSDELTVELIRDWMKANLCGDNWMQVVIQAR